jgi:DNA modification methylase
MCGDSTIWSDVDKLLSGRVMDMIFTDPPYAVFGSSTGMKKAVADVNMIKPFFRLLGDSIKKSVKPTGHVYVFCDWRTYPVISAEIGKFVEVKNNIIWCKPAAGYQGSYYSNNYECICFFVKEPETISMYDSFRNKGQPKHRAIYQSNVWNGRSVPIKERKHFAAKPVELAKYAIINSTDPNQYVLDLFIGSGSTLIACEETGRICYGMEIDPKYCDITIKRWEELTGKCKKTV